MLVAELDADVEPPTVEYSVVEGPILEASSWRDVDVQKPLLDSPCLILARI